MIGICEVVFKGQHLEVVFSY